MLYGVDRRSTTRIGYWIRIFLCALFLILKVTLSIIAIAMCGMQKPSSDSVLWSRCYQKHVYQQYPVIRLPVSYNCHPAKTKT